MHMRVRDIEVCEGGKRCFLYRQITIECVQNITQCVNVNGDDYNKAAVTLRASPRAM